MTQDHTRPDPGANHSPAMIDAEDVHMTFRAGDEDVQALRGATFRLPATSTTFIVGPSARARAPCSTSSGPWIAQPRARSGSRAAT